MKKKNTIIPRIPMLAVCVVFAAWASAQDQADEHIKKTFQVAAGGSLTVVSDLGSIDVRSGAGNALGIDVQIANDGWSRRRFKEFMDEFQVDFQQTGNDVRVDAEYDRGLSSFWDSIGRHVKVRFTISVPAKYNVDLKTAGGGISVNDLDGTVLAGTSGGSLTFGEIKGSVTGKTSGGSIRLEGCDGTANVRTSGGSIRLGRVRGDVDAHTSGGSIEVEEVMGALSASTSGGYINAAISEQPKADCRLTTSGGSITVRMASAVKVNVDAQTSGGHVSTDFPVMVQGRIDRNALRAEINGGGPELYLRTSGGSIHLEKMP